MEGDIKMLRSSRKGFRVEYYISSLLPVYFLLIIFMFFIYIQRVFDGLKFKRIVTFDLNKFCELKEAVIYCFNEFKKVSIYNLKQNLDFNLVFLVFLAFFICSILCLFSIKHAINETLNNSKSLGIKDVEIKDSYNSGFREFIFSVILPLMSTFSINDYPIATLVMVTVFQFIIYFFFINSSDLFPNISLVLLGYSFFYVSNDYGKSSLQYVLGKKVDIDKLIKGYNKVEVIKLGEKQYPDNIGVALKFKEK